ncbi:MAG TPA: Mrp/NBP35 family ATP-binding protein [Paracoccus sp. (in: a-proteobacteria)]|uniref:Mrp/NBP35 family ATP-binding protein n=1 Tax=uncultured Paracoccus sp. TaxID=189685 RepID=UPI002610498B|nr:Mrp/NBP35 family ATP-binding protein [uncultured Paracoccus sp.]HMQ42591.1 Mrp/NBP35 family ATP-binding protein [Paracoccus sp. (in: a-proteobacteria)]HMR34921.1 Mrp/NBP35 family ATP-binding protein [Paracoccus sp. (in: a-proteobacteria)]
MDRRIETEVKAALAGIVPLGALRALQVNAGEVSFVLDAENVPLPENAADLARAAVAGIEGVRAVKVGLSAPAPAPEFAAAAGIEGVAAIVAVGSGKGGVGKSTVAANLALALADLGYRVGLLDADIYGPSQPTMLGATGRPVGREEKIVPLSAHGIRCMSVGMLMDPGKALVWRGPMLVTAIRQLLHDVIWAPMDVLVVDLPPGTGDVQITLAQTVPLTGAVIVTTPQDVALIDARRAIDLFEQTGVPVIGLIENMSSHICTRCGQEDDVFGHGGGEAEAASRGIPFLGALPLSRPLRETGDAGAPILRAAPDSPEAARFREVAAGLVKQLDGAGQPLSRTQ